MNIILFTGDGCDICHDAEEKFKTKYKAELDSGEADIVNLDEDEGAQRFWMENDLPVAPIVAVVTDKQRLICLLDPDELLKEASPAVPGSGKQPEVDRLRKI